METIIKLIQEELDNQRFFTESLTESIKFEPIQGEQNGFISDVEKVKRFKYTLSVVDSSVKINSTYFDRDYKIATTSLGFQLYELKSDSIRLSYINEFWIDHQEVINKVLSFLSQDENKERQFNVDHLVTATREQFGHGAILSEALEVLNKIMHMLIEQNVVLASTVQGKECIHYSPKTLHAIETSRFVFVPHT